MKNKVITYFKHNKITKPFEVDQLIISAFIYKNNISLKNNKLIKSYLITSMKKTNNKLFNTFLDLINNEIHEFNFEELIKLFEYVISPSDRIVNGAVYTPKNIRTYITNTVLKKRKDISTIKIADISCGCGGFLFNAAQNLKKLTNETYKNIFEKNIFGLDIQEYSIQRTKLLLSLLALINGEDIPEFKFNLFVGDALIFNWNDYISDFSGFNIILGNPPYVCARNLNIETKKLLKNWSVSSTGNSDLYIPFFQIAIENLASEGILGYITMNTFFKSLNGRALREYFQNKQLNFQIIDFGCEQIFRSRNTYTCICFIKNKISSYLEYYKSESNNLNDKKQFNKIKYSLLNSKKGWNLKDTDIISKIEEIGSPFGEKYKTSHGLATLKNDIYIFKPIYEDEKYYYFNKDKDYKIEKELCKSIINSNKLSSSYSLKDLEEKIIFPYNRDTHSSAKLIKESILKTKYPEAYRYLLSKKDILAKRDKGSGKYEDWFAFGRTQSLNVIGNKLFLPKMSNKTPSSIISTDKDLLFYNGIAIVGHTKKELLLIKRIIESRLFWYYIKTTSKPYSSDYYSLNGNYINNFGIYNFSDEEINYILKEKNQKKLDLFIENKYGIQL
ncbi:Eco57I restriction-modification methylase domain-containing protein [Gilliamella apis]|uniref:site-specific DNA-methyltransferase (adenine-specific) n=1 Tax=Gilliamella apis TaxID=1970738 RepID=A0A2V4DKQ3_9GAMM|nr:DNA methyltransferase [Gilliamella apis]PXY88446.1 N-6 DNA methylase [Gilliamella apis]WLS94347.1 N-6 DNA methylase [Gilliamella apis]